MVITQLVEVLDLALIDHGMMLLIEAVDRITLQGGTHILQKGILIDLSWEGALRILIFMVIICMD